MEEDARDKLINKKQEKVDLTPGKEIIARKAENLGPGEYISKSGQVLKVKHIKEGVKNVGMYEVTVDTGAVPKLLSGLFTERREAENAVQAYVQKG